MQISQKVEIITKSGAETKKLGVLLARTIQQEDRTKKDGALVVSLEGDLGAGKTTFAQGFAEGLGIKERITSPTFVILKIYRVKNKKDLIHIDAYRIGARDLAVLNWKEFVKETRNIILIDWGGRVKKILPKDTIRILFAHHKSDERKIKILGQ